MVALLLTYWPTWKLRVYLNRTTTFLTINSCTGDQANIINVYQQPADSAHGVATAKDICWAKLHDAVGNASPGTPFLVEDDNAYIHQGLYHWCLCHQEAQVSLAIGTGQEARQWGSTLLSLLLTITFTFLMNTPTYSIILSKVVVIMQSSAITLSITKHSPNDQGNLLLVAICNLALSHAMAITHGFLCIPLYSCAPNHPSIMGSNTSSQPTPVMSQPPSYPWM